MGNAVSQSPYLPATHVPAYDDSHGQRSCIQLTEVNEKRWTQSAAIETDAKEKNESSCELKLRTGVGKYANNAQVAWWVDLSALCLLAHASH